MHPLLELLDERTPRGCRRQLPARRRRVRLAPGSAIPPDADRPRPRRIPRRALGSDCAGRGRAQQATPMREDHQRRVPRPSPALPRAGRRRRRPACGGSWLRARSGERRRPASGSLIDALPGHCATARVATLDGWTCSAPQGSRRRSADASSANRPNVRFRLTRRERDAAMGGAGGARGFSEVLAALNDARVAHVVYDPEVRYRGAHGEDGRLSTTLERRPAAGHAREPSCGRDARRRRWRCAFLRW
jgi:hypothetical protein